MVWEEVRRLNEELGVTIFLTTQYLEEADVLADRVGIIDAGLLVAQGSPEELKRNVGNDLIVVDVAGATTGDEEAAERAIPQLEALATVTGVTSHGSELSVSSSDGASLVNDLVVALNQADLRVQSLTLRTPTLDDVFLSVTGHRIEPAAEPTAAEGARA